MTTLPYPTCHPVLAAATWSRLAEPDDQAAGFLVGALGAGPALAWLTEEATSHGQVRVTVPAPAPPPEHWSHSSSAWTATWAKAVARWVPRLEGLDIRREVEALARMGGTLVLPGSPDWPGGLDDLSRPPFCLWVRGQASLLRCCYGGSGESGLGDGCTDRAAPLSRDACGRGCWGTLKGTLKGSPEGSAEGIADGIKESTAEGTVVERCAKGQGQTDRDRQGTGVTIALVGARASSRYGEQVASQMAEEVTGAGGLVVSGGAYGIDAAAHRGALLRGATLSVSAGGVDRLYPAGNARLLQQVIEEGALVSEVPLGCQPGRHRFLSRNRVIAALAAGTVVVEAAWRSGALSTARHARDLGRQVGAVPGPVTSMASAGCHRLLREGAVCVTDAQEAIELVSPIGQQNLDLARQPHTCGTNVGLLDGLDEQQARVLDAMPARQAATVATIARAAGMSPVEVGASLGLLELAGRVRREGERWRRT